MTEPTTTDFEEFLQSKSSEQARAALPETIVRDLVASRSKLVLTYLAGAGLGDVVSLMICAQCSLGLSPLAWQTSLFLHSMPDPWCPILCGFIFGFSPTLVTLLYLSRFQHRFLIFRMGWLPALVPLLASCLMLLSGDGHSWAFHSIWAATAILTPYGIELLAALFLRQGIYRAP